jgi:hypothetical protein
MEKWIAVRASAVFSIAAGVATLVFSGILGITLILVPPRGSGPFPPAVLQAAGCVAAVMFAGFGIWGLATGIGVVRRRAWARGSVIVFSAMAILFALTGLGAILIIPQPDNPDVNVRLAGTVRHAVEAFYAGLALLGAWWLALFNRESSKRYFSEKTAGNARPLSVSAIGCYLLASAAATALCAALGAPALFFGVAVTGWTAMALYSAYTVIQVYLGAGLLQLDESARVWAIVYFLASASNGVALITRPAFAARMHAIQGRFEMAFNRNVSAMPGSISMLIVIAVAAAIPIWFLVRRRAAFTPGGHA